MFSPQEFSLMRLLSPNSKNRFRNKIACQCLGMGAKVITLTLIHETQVAQTQFEPFLNGIVGMQFTKINSILAVRSVRGLP